MTCKGKTLHRIFGFLLVLLGGMLCVTPISAQEVLPEAPTELEGFRLDNPPPEPGPAAIRPTTEPTEARPAEESPATKPATTAQPRTNKAPQVPASSPNRNSAESSATESATSANEPRTDESQAGSPLSASRGKLEPAPIQSDSAATVPKNQGEAAVPPTGDNEPNLSLWLILVGLAALFAVGLFLFLRRKKEKPSARQNVLGDMQTSAVELKADILIEDDPYFGLVDATKSSSEPLAVSQQKPMARPELDMRFVPDRAVLGMVNLTIKGELRIVNHGKAVARNLRLRTAAICANADQGALIAAFNNDEPGPEPDFIDNIRKGERISIAIEVSLPRTEIDSYIFEGRQICVPIIMADLVYSGMDAGSRDRVQIAAMIGREANPPTTKMGPLRIDLGPRSFDMLGQRPVAA